MKVHSPIGVVGAGAGDVLGRTLGAPYSIKVKLAKANTADYRAIVGKGRALEIEKVVGHVQRTIDRQVAATIGHILNDRRTT
jgi:hypothetical protein